jgi:hypothetical protein
MLDQCVERICPQVDDVLVIDNASEPQLTVTGCMGVWVELRYIPDQPPNLSRFWNYGLDYFYDLYDGEAHDVAVLCDDAFVPPGWFKAVTAGMRETGATIGCSDPFNRSHGPMMKRGYDNDITNRMPGWAWILDGTSTLRADESMAWWWLDTDIDFTARRMGGMVMVGEYGVPNVRPNDYTVKRQDLQEQAGRDGEAFAVKWGARPW